MPLPDFWGAGSRRLVARDLYSRLKRLKTAHPQGREQKPPPASSPRPVIPGWMTPAPLVQSRIVREPVDGPPGTTFYSRLLGREIVLSDLCFMDTETTGLSGGAGTSVFLVGTATYSEGCVTLHQIFLADFPGEPDYLHLVEKELYAGSVWVSYNGKAFDSRLLQTRFLMNGKTMEIPEQLDLLYWSRRLWKRLIGSCTLGDIERNVLRLPRGADIPGSEIPDRYFDYLRDGLTDGLEPVIVHHKQDIVSLVSLFFTIEKILASLSGNNRVAVPIEYDRVALGCHLAERSHPDCVPLLRGVVLNPLPAENLPSRERAAIALSRHLRRTDAAQSIPALWRALWDDGSVLAGIQLAKHAEHRERNPYKAMDLVAKLAPMISDERTLSRLSYRRARLARKLAR